MVFYMFIRLVAEWLRAPAQAAKGWLGERRFGSRPGMTVYKLQVRVRLGFLTDLIWHLPKNVSV